MHCSIKRKNSAIRQNTFYGGGHSWGVIQKGLMSLGGQEENVSSKKNSPAPPRDFINKRSLNCRLGLQYFNEYHTYEYSLMNKSINKVLADL